MTEGKLNPMILDNAWRPESAPLPGANYRYHEAARFLTCPRCMGDRAQTLPGPSGDRPTLAVERTEYAGCPDCQHTFEVRPDQADPSIDRQVEECLWEDRHRGERGKQSEPSAKKERPKPMRSRVEQEPPVFGAGRAVVKPERTKLLLGLSKKQHAFLAQEAARLETSSTAVIHEALSQYFGKVGTLPIWEELSL